MVEWNEAKSIVAVEAAIVVDWAIVFFRINVLRHLCKACIISRNEKARISSSSRLDREQMYLGLGRLLDGPWAES